jgi:hypothetical protein
MINVEPLKVEPVRLQATSGSARNQYAAAWVITLSGMTIAFSLSAVQPFR